jgi:DNA-binding transcriptional regulator YdaS (Cro superfamily)
MELREWLFRKKITQTKLAKEVGVSKQYMYLVCSNKHRVSSKLALKIEKFTNGEVTAEELVFPEKYAEAKQ